MAEVQTYLSDGGRGPPAPPEVLVPVDEFVRLMSLH